MEAKCGEVVGPKKQMCRHTDVLPSHNQTRRYEAKYQVKKSVHKVNGPWTDYKSRAYHCQEVTVDNIPKNHCKTFDMPSRVLVKEGISNIEHW